MPDIHECLTAWRRAERERDALPRDTADWENAQQEVLHARLVYQATVAGTVARYRESADLQPLPWWPTLGSTRSYSAR